MEEKKVLNDDELEEVEGGSHLSSEEALSIKPGQILIYEDDQGIDLAKVEYLGELNDPGPLIMWHLKVRFLEIYHGEAIDTGYNEYIRVGDVEWVSRWNLDFPERA